MQRAYVECARMFHQRVTNFMDLLVREKVLGEVHHYVVRYEVQGRG